MVFGGCLALARHLCRRIPFDRRVPRGEDMDYLLNARMYGYHFFMHRQWGNVHDPPSKTHETWKRMRMDILRFINECKKLEKQVRRPNMTRVEPHELDPYPGEFLRGDLLENVAVARDAEENPRDGFANLLELQRLWERLLNAIADSAQCRRGIYARMTH